MARAGRSAHTGKPRPPSSKANAAGFAKRQSRKATALSGLADVYEYQPDRVRRSRASVDTKLDKEEAAEFGFGGRDDEDDLDAEREELRARLIGENEDGEGIDSADDEEIESDDAFEEADDERFAGFNFASDKKKPKSKGKGSTSARTSRAVRFADVDLNEEDEEDAGGEMDEGEDNEPASDEEEEEAEGMLDLVDFLDGKAQPYFASDSEGDDAETTSRKEKGKGKNTAPRATTAGGPSLDGEDEMHAASVDEEDDDDDGEDAEDDEDSEEDDSADEAQDPFAASASDDDEADATNALDNLSSFVSSLDPGGKKRKADDDPSTGAATAPARKRRVLKERTEAGAENEFAARMSNGTSKLNLEDLLAPLASQSSTLLSLKKSTKVLSASKSGTLAAPLPQRTQDRLDREAAYEQTKEEVDKWKATMKRIKEAEHLSFPLQAEPAGRTSNLELAAKFKPTTELESAVDKLLKTAQMRDEDMPHTEDLKMNHLSVEEVQARRAELRKMRELMFRAEVKAKRVAKIKSKAYRRIRKKGKERLAAQLGDGDDDAGDDDEAARMEKDVQRARERATLRHKNTGKWAKSMKMRGELDVDQRREIGEMLDRGERLRRKIRGEGSGDEGSGDDDDDDERHDGEMDVEGIKASAFDEIRRLREEAGDEDEDEDAGKKSKSVFEMKFMKDAMQRDMRNADRSADDFLKEMGAHMGSHSDGGDSVDPEFPEGDSSVQRLGGRVSFHPGSQSILPLHAAPRVLGSLPSDTSSVTLLSTDLLPDPTAPASDSLRITPPPSWSTTQPSTARQVNPWLVKQDASEAVAVAKKKNVVVVSKESAAADKSKTKLRKRMKKREEEREKAKEDAELEITADHVVTLDVKASSTTSQTAPSSGKVKGTPLKARSSKNVGSDDDANSEVDEQERILGLKGKGKKNVPKAFQQRDLVARAFAGDNVVQDFADAKRREIQADAPHEVDTTLPGWGSWGGLGTRKQAPKPHLIKRVAGVDPKSRADYGKDHVIISEKRDKKAAKYLVKDLPHPYTSKAQFERSMDTPVGPEWNTRVGFQRGTLPRVVKKMGTIINPLEKAR